MRTVGDRRLGRALLALVVALAVLTLASAAPAAPQTPGRALAPGDDCPFPLTAPWPAGQVWMAGNGGNYYGDGAHVGAEQYAVDFNRFGAEDLGQPIYAAADGVVVSAGWLAGYGNSVMVAHRFGVRTTYGHFMQTPVRRRRSARHDGHRARLLPAAPATPRGRTSTSRCAAGRCRSEPEPMEGRSLSDGILLVAGPKLAVVQDAPVWRIWCGPRRRRPSGSQMAHADTPALVGAGVTGAARDGARGGRSRHSRPHAAY